MADETTNVIQLDDRFQQRGGESHPSMQAAAEHKRWLEIWAEAWAYEGARRGKSLPANDRRALARHIQHMVNDIKKRHKARSGKIAAAFGVGGQMTLEEARDRGCPHQLLQAATAPREYRIDRFTNSDTKLLRGKLLDWLRATELLATLLDRKPKREIIILFDESRIDFAERERSSLSDSYDAIFKLLAEQLQQITTTVARECDFATYYECCDKMHAAWFDGDIIEDDGWCLRFKRNAFEQYAWAEVEGGPGGDPARSPLGLVGEILIHTPLARVRLARAEVTDTMRSGGIVGDMVYVDFDVHLALRPDVDDPREAGAFILQPLITTADADLVHPDEKKPFRWWNQFREVSLDSISEEALQEIFQVVQPFGDQHIDRARKIARIHLGEFRLVPITSATCQAWLSFGANTLAEEFTEFFWHDPDGDSSNIVSAPSGTLAGFIQLNIIKADASGQGFERIDRRLAADAALKTDVLQRLLERKRVNYELHLKDAGFINLQESETKI